MQKIEIDLEDWLTIAEAARLRNITRQAMSKLAKRGRVETLKIAGHIFVKKSSVTSFVEEPAGRKPSKRSVDANHR